MHTVCIPPRFDAWRETARDLLAKNVAPESVWWSEQSGPEELFAPSEPTTVAEAAAEPMPTAAEPHAIHVTKEFLFLARSVAAHRDPRRWSVLYQLLWRHTHGGERSLLMRETDPQVRLANQWAKAVGRDIHKMHAFVRFRLTGTDPHSGREQFVAWFEPEHRITRLAAPFFRKRFSGMDWSILTPDECAHWDGHTLVFTPGLERDQAPDHDALESLWRTYYRNIFNPARIKVKAMQSEMPQKYWKNLPEAELIPELIHQGNDLVNRMLETAPRPVKPLPKVPYLQELHRRNQSEPAAE